MNNIKFSQIETSKSLIWPNGKSGNVLKTNTNGITSIDYIDGAMIVTAVKGSQEEPIRFAVKDWVYGILAHDQSDPLRCEGCGEKFVNAQGLGKHALSCRTKTKDLSPGPAEPSRVAPPAQ